MTTPRYKTITLTLPQGEITRIRKLLLNYAREQEERDPALARSIRFQVNKESK